MRTPEQRGRYGRWLVAAREGRGYSTAVQALDALAAAGITIGKSTYAEYESGSKVPSRNHLPLLESFWGAAPLGSAGEGTTLPPSADPALLALIEAQTAALKDQTAAFLALAASIDRAATNVTDRVGSFGDELTDLVRLLRPPATGADAPPVDDAHPASSNPGQ